MSRHNVSHTGYSQLRPGEMAAYRGIPKMTGGHLFRTNEQLPQDILQFRNERNMIDLTELMYWGYYGIDYPAEEEVTVEGTGAEETKIMQTDEMDKVERHVLVFVTENYVVYSFL